MTEGTSEPLFSGSDRPDVSEMGGASDQSAIDDRFDDNADDNCSLHYVRYTMITD